MAELRAQKKNKQLNTEMFNDDDPDFSITETPEKWVDESAIILCQKFYYSYIEKGSSQFEYKETSRKRIKILDDAALKHFSIYYYKSSVYDDDEFRIRVIKPDGSIEKIDNSIAVDVSYNEIPKNYKTTYGYYTKYKKLAVPNLERGDIIDYSQSFKNETKPYSDYAFSRFTFTLSNSYPTLKQKFFFNVDEKFNVSFRSYNGAPELKEGDAGVNRNGKVKEDIRTYTIEDNDREKYSDEYWKLRYLTDPTVKFQVFYIPQMKLERVNHFVNKERIITQEIPKEDLRKFLFNNQSLLSTKLHEDAYRYINRYHKEKSNLEKVEIAYYYIRHQESSSYSSISSLQSYYAGNETEEIYEDDISFSNTFAKTLEKLKIEFEYVVAVKRKYGTFDNVLFPQELTMGIKVENQYVFAFSQYSTFDYIPSNLRGAPAILYKDMPTRYENPPISEEIIPKSNSSKNRTITEQLVTIDDEFSLVTMNETTTRKGYNKSGQMAFILKGSRYAVKDEIRFNPRYRTFVETPERGNKARIAEKKRIKDAEEKEEKKTRYENLKKYHNDDAYELDEYLDFDLVSDGRFSDSLDLVFKEKYTLKNFINKAGRNYILNIGQFIGKQFQLDEEDMIRVADINLNYERSYKYVTKIKIPEGYKVEGLESLKYNIDNEMGSFISTIKVEKSYLIVSTEKSYKTLSAEKKEWPKYIDFLEGAYNFSQKKVILKKI
jgi:hypothetical protein